MTEDDAQAWIAELWGDDRLRQLRRYVELLLAESERQNLIARSTVDSVWARHIADSAQLVLLAEARDPIDAAWLDIGSGAGLPGVVAALLQKRRVIMIEPRRGRVAFLELCIAALGLNASVVQTTVERFARFEPAAIISARAVASIDTLFANAYHLADRDTVWVMPKGRSYGDELKDARLRWHGVFHVEQSLTAPESGVVIATGVTRK
ncbi:16S rRNA (guanine(527)-N(7))-methyltransferase RsmG [Sphingomonas baiyangensis]|uniref:Ribosomal RNA small subunit methyltransferase G n=1 Tax=Sphingomonas baiyangensis TaxID=2572576 RepID=A0A4U1L557_9SPHN|nr:16S rRNA (guanine(527)-N(7))-methyltransferase RsmG [Sphingomonas baiyangensis]TKD51932.1 16S rRNA (guanine(527)-N(7))-methyltransferase RsmG [Sphingomonas baiyangensis]